MSEIVAPPQRHPRAILIAVLIFAALSTLCAWWGDGFLEADAATHYLYARRAFHDPALFLDVWGRPVCTGIYAIPAALGGLHAVRFTSLLLALGTAELVRRIAAGQGFGRPSLAFIFTLSQPLVFLHSFSELTELPFAFLLAGAFLAYQHRQFALMAILAGLLPAARPEGFGFGLLAAIALLAHRRWLALPLLALPLCLWNYLGWWMWDNPDYSALTLGPIAIGRYLPRPLHGLLWLKANWPYSGDSTYARGSIFQFAAVLPMVTSPLIFPAVLVGIGGGWRGLCLPSRPPHVRRCAALILFLPLGVLAVHSYLFYRGKMASNGEARYLLSVAPFWALLAATGWQWISDRLRLRHPFALAAVAALLPLSANFWWQVIPLRNAPDWHAAARLVRWHQTDDLARRYPLLVSAHPAVAIARAELSVSSTPPPVTRRLADAPPAGAMLLWDPIYCGFNADANAVVRPAELMASGWVLLGDGSAPVEQGWQIFLSPTDADGRTTPYENRAGDFVVGRGRLDPLVLTNHSWRQYRPPSSGASSAPASSPSR